jgi:hypothetical protein
MARAELRDSWYVKDSSDELRRDLHEFFRRQRMKVVAEQEGDDNILHAEQGSQLWTRLLGGWFVSATKLPKRATVKFRSTPKGTALHASIEETLGFGVLDPLLADKYDKFFENWMRDLEDALELDPRAPKPGRERKDQ